VLVPVAPLMLQLAFKIMTKIPLDKILKTEHLLLRAVSFDDIDLVWDVSQIKGFNDGMVWDPPETKDKLVSTTEKNITLWQEGTAYNFTVILNSSKTSIGRVGIRLESTASTWNIGFWIHPDYWGNGFATEASQAVMDFTFAELKASKITTAHALWNLQSKRVIEKLGFHFTGVNPCGFMKKGTPVAENEYVISRQEC
jgi:[ribosomal protein S5]-alanine N-acetyltransferase